ncbi:hypothetical protein [Streptomyces parvulus]|uniref:hypothetical protein n=1 Tax=Streptomyces parvulus TaxID=146923 RepID=UPI0033B0FE6E
MTNLTPAELATDAERYKADYLNACKTIADMHAAATGRTGEAPTRGVVEDVADVRDRMLAAEAALVRVHHVAALIHAGAPWLANHTETAARIRAAIAGPAPTDEETVPRALFDENARRHKGAIARVDELLATIERVRTVVTSSATITTTAGVHEYNIGRLDLARDVLAALDEPAPAATQATYLETTARVLSALHQVADDTVTRVITLHEQWVADGPPPLGVPLTRWWDARLAELHHALADAHHDLFRTQREELQRAETAFAQFREGEEPLAEGQHPATASPAQWLWLWNRSTPAERLARAEQIIKVSQEAAACFLENHGPKLEQLRHRLSTAEAAVTRTLHAMQLHRAGDNTPVSPGKVIDLLTRPAPDSTTEAPEPGTWDQAEQLRAAVADSMTAHTKELLARRTETLRKRAEEAEAERDGAYRERAHLVALLAAMTDGAVIAPAPDVEEPGWQIVYLTIGGRQASWHISPRDAALFSDVEHVPGDDPRARWDGHSTDDKYARIRQHTRLLARRCGPACAEAHTYTGRCESAQQVDDSHATAPDVVHPDTDSQASSPQQVDGPCPQHPHAPTFDGMCGGCTQYPADMQPAAPAGEEQPDVQQ